MKTTLSHFFHRHLYAAMLFALCAISGSQVKSQCLPAFTVDTTNCPTVVFTDFSTTQTGVIVAWTWDFGDGNIANTPNTSHTYTANGTYLVCLTITTSTFCSSNFCVPVTISCINPPVCTASFQYTAAQCPTISFFDNSTSSPGTVASWAWDFGDGNSSGMQNPSHTYAANGTYVTCLTITTTDGCADTFCDTLTINCIPGACQADFSYTIPACPTVQFFDFSTSLPGTIISWFWSFGDAQTGFAQNPVHTYPTSGVYVACLTIMTDDGCSSTFCDTIVINCNAGNSVGICTDEPTKKLDIQGEIRIRELPQEPVPMPRMVVADEFGVLYWRPFDVPPSVQPSGTNPALDALVAQQAALIKQLEARLEELERKVDER